MRSGTQLKAQTFGLSSKYKILSVRAVLKKLSGKEYVFTYPNTKYKYIARCISEKNVFLPAKTLIFLAASHF